MNAENMYDAWDNGDRHEIRQQFARRGGFGMTREDIENFTRQAGGFDATPEFLERFAALVAAAEREACAKVCDGYADSGSDHEAGAALNIQAAIRARGDNNAP